MGVSADNQAELWVRHAEQDDLYSIVRLVSLMHDEDPPFPDRTTRLGEILSGILKQPQRHLLVAGLGDTVCATADMLIVSNLSRGGRPWSVVENVVVDPRYRRKGIATALMLELLRVAQAGGCYKMQLVSAEKRTAAHALYEALGFSAHVRGFRRYLYPEDRFE